MNLSKEEWTLLKDSVTSLSKFVEAVKPEDTTPVDPVEPIDPDKKYLTGDIFDGPGYPTVANVYPTNTVFNLNLDLFPTHSMSDALVENGNTLALQPSLSESGKKYLYALRFDGGKSPYVNRDKHQTLPMHLGMPINHRSYDGKDGFSPVKDTPLQFEANGDDNWSPSWMDESYHGNYPLDNETRIQNVPPGKEADLSYTGINDLGDRHCLTVVHGESGPVAEYDIYRAWRKPDGGWSGCNGAKFNLQTCVANKEGYTSSNAAGLPFAPFILTAYECFGLEKITHMMCITGKLIEKGYQYPASHGILGDGGRSGRNELLKLGSILRFKPHITYEYFLEKSKLQNYPLPRWVESFFEAGRKYGFLLIDKSHVPMIAIEESNSFGPELGFIAEHINTGDLELVDTSSLPHDKRSYVVPQKYVHDLSEYRIKD